MEGVCADSLPNSPFRSPAWRWLRTGLLDSMRRRPHRGLDDRWVDAARRFLARPDQHAARPDRFDAAIGNALALSRETAPHQRWHLEALLLTTEPLNSVALRCALSPDVVEAYHALFFACRDRPAARDWLTLTAVGCGPWNDFGGPQPEGLWKFAAFSGGPLKLDVMIAVTTGRPMPDSVRAACARRPGLDEDGLRTGVKLTTAMMTSRSPEETKSLVAIHDELLALTGRRVMRREKTTPLARLVRTFVTSHGGRGPLRDEPTRATGSTRKTKGSTRTPSSAGGRRRTDSRSGSAV